MAVSSICTLVKANATSDAQTPITLASGTDVYIPVTGRSILIGITPAATGNVTFAAGNGIAATKDLTVSFTKDKVSFIQLDTSSYEDVEAKLANGTDNPNYKTIKITPAVAGTLVAVNPL